MLRYIGYSEYFATGEGVTEIFVSGTKVEIIDFTGSFYERSLEYYTFDDIRKYLQEIENDAECIKEHDREDYNALRTAYKLQYHAPTVAQIIKQGGYCTFKYKLHFNLS
ncbi:hypothetical protein AB4140_06340 [Shewanella sp. 10N.286.51.B2]|uniref:hypothetical protein n=1 Tax=Shewanella sp. 10N.286.51.B2 TaxID=3229707 RepID=UPI00354CB562